MIAFENKKRKKLLENTKPKSLEREIQPKGEF